MLDKEIHSSVRFNFLHTDRSLRDRRRLKAFLIALFKKEKTAMEGLNYIFCTDKYLLQINQQFLQHNDYTDIITFNLATRKTPVEGEIYISLDRVRENAAFLHEYFYRELHRVIFHGALHLCGYKDKTNKESELMRQKEDYYLDQYFK
jgi:probable rRNA maturation factor